MRTSRDDWVEEGFSILVHEGHQNLTVDALCTRLEKTKGSFYHHFGGRDGYVDALMEVWREKATARIVEVATNGADVRDRLRALNREASGARHARLERSVRAWSSQNERVAVAQREIDDLRLDTLAGLLQMRMAVPERSGPLARLFQLVFVGAQHLEPPLEGEELYATFRALEPLFDVEVGR